jgi:hypothetical protein
MEKSFQKYLQKFQEILNQLPSYSNKSQEVLDKFTDGFTKGFAFAVRGEKCESFNESIEICQDLDCLSISYTDHSNTESINFTKTNYSKSRSANYKNPKINNNNNNPSYSNFRMDKKPFKKFNVKNNFKPQRSFQKIVNSNTYSRNSKNFNKKIDIKNVTCLKCGKKDHYASKCFVQTNKFFRSAYKIMLIVL